MAKHQTITQALLKAIHDSGQSLYEIAKESGVDKVTLGKFVKGRVSMRLDRADKLASYFGLVVKPTKKDR